jgi:hypothetical protein
MHRHRFQPRSTPTATNFFMAHHIRAPKRDMHGSCASGGWGKAVVGLE